MPVKAEADNGEGLVKWDGKAPLVPSPSWNVSCHWAKYRTAKTAKPFKMCVSKQKDMISQSIAQSGRWSDCTSLETIWSTMTAKHKEAGPPLFVDIGANMGACSFFMASLGARVISFEPLPQSQYYYTMTAISLEDKEMRQSLDFFPMACGPDYEERKIFVASENAGSAILDVGLNAKYQAEAFPVRIVPCDDALWPDRSVEGSQVPNIALLKIDVEGFEIEALQGLRDLLKARAIKSIKTELFPQLLALHNHTAGEYCSFLREASFKLFHGQQLLTQQKCEEFDRTPDMITDIEAYLTSPTTQ